MRQLLDIIRKDTTRWECHPLLDNLADDFQILALLRDRRSAETTLLSFANDLMEVNISLHRDTRTATWAVRGNLIHQFPLYCDNLWPKSFRKHYISINRASSDFYEHYATSLNALRLICPDIFGINVNFSEFDTGQHLTGLLGDLVFGSNCYAKNLPLNLTANLFRSELALAQFFLLMAFADFYKGMLPRPIDGDTLCPVAVECSRRLFSAAPWQLFLCRTPDTTGLKAWDIVRVSRRSDEVKFGPPDNPDVQTPGTLFDFTEYRRPIIKREVESLLETGDLAGAINRLQAYSTLYPGSFYCHYKLAYIHQWLGQPDKAFAEFGKWANLHIEYGFYGGALTILDEMAELCPEDPRICLLRADAYSGLRQDAAATEELMRAGRLCIEAGFEHGLELFRRKMVRLWWGRLPSIENMTARQILRVDFCNDLGFYRRNKPEPAVARTRHDDSWPGMHGNLPVDIDDVRAMAVLKRTAEFEERHGSPEKQADALLKLAFRYLKAGFNRTAEQLYRKLEKLHPRSMTICLQHRAECCFNRGDDDGGIERLRELERCYRAMGLQNKADLVASKLEELLVRREMKSLGFEFDDDDRLYPGGNCWFNFEADKEPEECRQA
ncbi:MAG: hypothetical protein FDZ69_03030 [Deltaproteobacteria bacterium]|nr:MAG: hypothetical protein FDZ69_03030 [Deltaproteobacteria bacterium]